MRSIKRENYILTFNVHFYCPLGVRMTNCKKINLPNPDIGSASICFLPFSFGCRYTHFSHAFYGFDIRLEMSIAWGASSVTAIHSTMLISPFCHGAMVTTKLTGVICTHFRSIFSGRWKLKGIQSRTSCKLAPTRGLVYDAIPCRFVKFSRACTWWV